MSQENVIEVSFSSQNQLSKEIETLLDIDDPLEDLLNEFEDFPVEEEQGHGLFRLQETQDFKVSFKDTPKHMMDQLLAQTAHIKNDLNKLSYYLDEMNIDG